jgi:hypothetical protein
LIWSQDEDGPQGFGDASRFTGGEVCGRAGDMELGHGAVVVRLMCIQSLIRLGDGPAGVAAAQMDSGGVVGEADRWAGEHPADVVGTVLAVPGVLGLGERGQGLRVGSELGPGVGFLAGEEDA